MKKIIVTLLFIALFACDKVKEKKQDAITGFLEKAIEKETGQQVDLPDAENMQKNNASVTYKSEKKEYLSGEEKLNATVYFKKKKGEKGLSIALQITSEAGKSLVVSMSHVPENFSLPLKGKYAQNNSYDGTNPVATTLLMEMNENGMMTSKIPYEGTLTITKLTKELIEFEIDAKGSDMTDADSPSNWKAITGNGKITFPIVMSIGIDKNNVFK